MSRSASPAVAVPLDSALGELAPLTWRRVASGQLAEIVADDVRFTARRHGSYVEVDAAVRIAGTWWTQERLCRKIANQQDAEAQAQAWLAEALALQVARARLQATAPDRREAGLPDGGHLAGAPR